MTGVHAGPVRRGPSVLRDQRGAALLEFTFVLPIVLLVLVASLSLLWMLSARSTLSGAARDAARYASIRIDPYACDLDCDGVFPDDHALYPDAVAVAGYVNDRVGGLAPVTVAVEPGEATRLPNSAITVRVSRPLPLLLRPMGALFGWDELVYETAAKVRAE